MPNRGAFLCSTSVHFLKWINSNSIHSYCSAKIQPDPACFPISHEGNFVLSPRHGYCINSRLVSLLASPSWTRILWSPYSPNQCSLLYKVICTVGMHCTSLDGAVCGVALDGASFLSLKLVYLSQSCSYIFPHLSMRATVLRVSVEWLCALFSDLSNSRTISTLNLQLT